MRRDPSSTCSRCVRLTHAALGAMETRAARARSSTSRRSPRTSRCPSSATYGATKAFVHSFTHAVHEEARGHRRARDARVSGLHPHRVPRARRARRRPTLPEFVWQSADEVVDAALRDLDRGASVSIPGGLNKTVGAFSSVSPAGITPAGRRHRREAFGLSPCRRTTAVLLLSCPDQPGIVAAVADFVYRHGGNILDAQQHTDRTDGVFFQRIEFDARRLRPRARRDRARRSGRWSNASACSCVVRFSDDVPRVGVLVSTEAHCLVDLLARSRRGELPVEIPVVISNHADQAEVAELVRGRLRAPAGHRRHQAGAGSARCRHALDGARRDAASCSPATCRSSAPDFVRPVAGRASSTSTTRSCPRSAAGGRTTRRTNGA